MVTLTLNIIKAVIYKFSSKMKMHFSSNFVVKRDEENLNLQKVKSSALSWFFKWLSCVRTLMINCVQTMPWPHRPLEPCYLSCVLAACASVCQTEDFPTSIKLLTASSREKRGNSGGHCCQWWSRNVKTQRVSSCESITGTSYIHTPLFRLGLFG